MRMDTLGGLTVRLTGGTDGKGGGNGPLVVLLHGFGAPGDDLVPLSEYLDAPTGTRFLFPEAPISIPMGFGDSRAWWMIDMALHRQFVVKRMPDSGCTHHPGCPSYEPEVQQSGLGELVGEAVLESEPGHVELRVDFPWTRVIGRGVPRGEPQEVEHED